jgi:hypothetical protein
MSNAQKTPLSRSLSAFTQRKVLDEIDKRGRSLPCSVVSVDGPIVTVNFEVMGLNLPRVTMPLFGSEYVRLPIQPGATGVTFPCDVYLGGVSGLGGATADDTPRGNLSTLVFFPVGNKNWPAVDPDTLTLYGESSVKIQDSLDDNAHVIVNDSGITLAFGGHAIVINSTGVTIDGRVFLGHEHSGVQSGSSASGGVI